MVKYELWARLFLRNTAWIITIAAVFFLFGCTAKEPASKPGSDAKSEIVTISAAVSLKDAFTEIGELYKARSGGTVQFNFGASGVLQQQIENGAPVDVFASAGEKQMDNLSETQLIDAESRRDLARNSLVLIVPQPATVALSSFADLANPNVKKIAVGNPKTVPAGQYASEALGNMGLEGKVAGKLILAENVRQVLDYVVRGEVDAGIVYSTDARQAGSKVSVVATADESTHSPIRYPIALIGGSKNKDAGRRFIELVLSEDGQKVLQKYGFITTASPSATK